MTQPASRTRKVTRGPVGLGLDVFGEDRKARANAKAMAFPAAVRGVRRFDYADLQITVMEAPRLEPMENGTVALHVVVEAMRADQPVPVDNPYLFVNPPVMVPSVLNPDEVVEDLAEVFRQMLGEAVLQVSRRV